MSDVAPPALFYEMLRSFVTVARTLNLSEAERELNSTRQTIRRHISALEELKGVALFEVTGRQYRLTEAGADALPGARNLLARSRAWLEHRFHQNGGLFSVSLPATNGLPFYHLQQLPVSAIWTSAAEVIASTVDAWVRARGDVDDPAFRPMREHALLFRMHDNREWICSEVGEKSMFATWLGLKWARSSVGRPLSGMPGGIAFAELLTEPYDEIRNTHGLRYDHIFTEVIREDGEAAQAVGYERVLMGARYPDQSFVMVSVAARPHSMKIEGVDASALEKARESLSLF